MKVMSVLPTTLHAPCAHLFAAEHTIKNSMNEIHHALTCSSVRDEPTMKGISSSPSLSHLARKKVSATTVVRALNFGYLLETQVTRVPFRGRFVRLEHLLAT